MSIVDKMKEKIVLKVINTERNLDLLEQVPNLEMEGLGLSVVFYVSIMTGEQSAGILIKNEHLRLWEKKVSDLISLAEINTNRMHTFTIKSINEVLSGMFGFEEDLKLYDFLKLKNKYYKQHGNIKKDLKLRSLFSNVVV